MSELNDTTEAAMDQIEDGEPVGFVDIEEDEPFGVQLIYGNSETKTPVTQASRGGRYVLVRKDLNEESDDEEEQELVTDGGVAVEQYADVAANDSKVVRYSEGHPEEVYDRISECVHPVRNTRLVRLNEKGDAEWHDECIFCPAVFEVREAEPMGDRR